MFRASPARSDKLQVVQVAFGWKGDRRPGCFLPDVAWALRLMMQFESRPETADIPWRSLYRVAAAASLATYQGTAFHASYVIGSLAGIMVSAVMLRGIAFGKGPGYTGILGNVVGLGLYLPVIGVTVSAASGVILWVWLILLAHRFFGLGWNR